MSVKATDYLRIDINDGRVRKSLSFNRADSVARVISVTIVDAGTPVSFEGLLYAEILIKKADGYEADNSCVIDGNEIQYTIRSNDIAAIGANQAQIMLTYDTGEVLTTPPFIIEVYEKVMDPKVQKSTDEYTSITQQVVMANQYAKDAEDALTRTLEAEETVDAAIEEINQSRDEAVQAKEDADLYRIQAQTYATSASLDAQHVEIAREETLGAASAAAESQGLAADSANAAATSALSAKGFRDEASEARDSILEYADAAEQSANAARQSKEEAETAEQGAVQSAADAKEYRDETEDIYKSISKESLQLGVTHDHAFYGDYGYAAYNHSLSEGNPHRTTYSEVGADEAGAAAAAYMQAAAYTDQKIADLINGAPATLDTLKEIADAFKESQEVVQALQAAIGSKAADVDLQAHKNNETIHVTAEDKNYWDNKVDVGDPLGEVEGYPVNATTLAGRAASDYALNSDLTNYITTVKATGTISGSGGNAVEANLTFTTPNGYSAKFAIPQTLPSCAWGWSRCTLTNDSTVKAIVSTPNEKSASGSASALVVCVKRT